MSTIPYRGAVRPDTGLYNAKLGTWLFLASEVMFFGALYSSYVFLRVANPAWSAAAGTLPVHLNYLCLLCLIATAACAAQAWALLRADAGRPPLPWLAGVLVFGVAALLLMSLGVSGLHAQDIHAATSNFYGMYLVLCNLQRLHLLGLLLGTAYLLVFMKRDLLRDSDRYQNHVECLGLLWQFLLLHWLLFMTAFHLA